MYNYYVYTARDSDNNIVYVGSGKGNRINHVNSGCSHSKLINSHVHTYGELTTEKVACSLSKNTALELEQDYINRYAPKFNKRKAFCAKNCY